MGQKHILNGDLIVSGSLSTTQGLTASFSSSSDVFLNVTNTYVSASDTNGSTGIQFNYGPTSIPAARIIAVKNDDFTNDGFQADSSFAFQNVFNGTYRTWFSSDLNGAATLSNRNSTTPGLTIDRNFSSTPMLLLRSGSDNFNNYVGFNISSSNQAYINFDNTGEFFIGSAIAYNNSLTRHFRITPNDSTVTTINGKGTTSSTIALRVENANASASLQIRDDGIMVLGTNNNNYLGLADSSFTININNIPLRINGTNLFYVRPYGSTDMLRVQAQGVQIGGQKDPNYTLDVSGSGRFTNGLIVTGSSTINGDITIHGTASVDVLITNYQSSSIIYSSGSTKFGDTMDDTHQFTGSMYVTASSVDFNFGGSAQLNFTQGINQYQTLVSAPTHLVIQSGDAGIFRIQRGSASNVNIEVDDADNVKLGKSSALYISGSGNVGIGTTTPAYKLDVNGNVRVGGTDNYIFGNTGSNYIRFYQDSLLILTAGTAVRFDSNLRIDGNRQIQTSSGTSSYFQFYEIPYDGFSRVIRQYQPFALDTSGVGMISRGDLEFRIDSNNDSTTSNLLITKDSGTELFRIQENGNVGIGTTTPSYKLDVSGSARFTDGITISGYTTISGDVTIHGTASVDVLITNYQSSSIIYSSGSTKFGDTLDDTHQFTGSLYVTGSNAVFSNDATINGVVVGLGGGSVSSNTVVGNSAFNANTTGIQNTAIGYLSAYNTTSNYNTAVGTNAGFSNSVGDANTYIGNSSARFADASGSYNTLLGNSTGYQSSGSYNTYLGANSAYNASGSRNIFIGYQAGYNETGSDLLYIENTNTTSPLIGGDFSANRVGINRPVSALAHTLDVGGSISVSGSVIDYEVPLAGFIAPGATNVISFDPTATSAAFVDYVLYDGLGNQRVGTIQASINQTAAAAVINEVTTIDIGNTSAVSFGITYGTPTVLTATNGNITAFDIKYMVRYF